MLKITSGKFRRHRIKVPTKKGVRPTQSRLRLNVFNYLGDFVKNAKVLDLFAGSGAFGLEALSRGARYAVFVDKVSRSVFTIKNNIKKLGVEDSTEVLKKDAIKYLVRAKKLHEGFDIIFIDPPFDKLLKMEPEERLSYLMELLDRAAAVLNPRSVIVLKMHKKLDIPVPEGMLIFDTYTQGINKIYYLLQKKYVK